MEDLIEAYLSVYEESDLKARAKAAVDHQRHGTHGDDDAQKSTQRSVDKLKTMPKVTRSSAALAAKGVESDVNKSNAYAPQRQKPGTTGAYRMEQADLYDVVLDHLLDEGYADTEDNAITIMANMSEEWRENILERFVPPNKEKSERINTFLNKSLDHLKLYSKQIDTATQELEDKKIPTYNIGKLVKKTNSLSKRMGSARSALSPRSNIRKFRRDK